MARNGPTRRGLLAGGAVATAVLLAGCTGNESLNRLNPFWNPPITMTVVAASGDETDTTCSLSAEAVERHPPLQSAMEKLADAEPGTKVTKGLTTETGQAISNTFTEHCQAVGGLYRYDGEWYLVGLTFKSQDDHRESHENGDGHDHGNGTETTETPAN